MMQSIRSSPYEQILGQKIDWKYIKSLWLTFLLNFCSSVPLDQTKNQFWVEKLNGNGLTTSMYKMNVKIKYSKVGFLNSENVINFMHTFFWGTQYMLR